MPRFTREMIEELAKNYQKANLEASVDEFKKLATLTFDDGMEQAEAASAIEAACRAMDLRLQVLRDVMWSSLYGDDPKKAIRQALVDYAAAVDEFISAFDPTKPEGTDDYQKTVQIIRKDGARQMVFGVFSVTTVGKDLLLDRQDEVIETDQMEDAAYDYVLNARVAGESHDRYGAQVGRLVESVALTYEKQSAIVGELQKAGIAATMSLGCELWWGGFYIEDAEVWKKVESGEYRSFSIGGKATRESL